MSDQTIAHAPQDENQLMLERREKLKAMRQAQAEGKGVAFPNDFKPADHAADLFGDRFAGVADIVGMGDIRPLVEFDDDDNADIYSSIMSRKSIAPAGTQSHSL